MNDIVRAFKEVDNAEDIYNWLKQRGTDLSARKRDRTTNIVVVDSYTAHNSYGSLVEFKCETDFVARSDEFKHFTREICIHVAATSLPACYNLWDGSEFAFLEQLYVRDISKSIRNLVDDISAKTGEKIEIGRVAKFE